MDVFLLYEESHGITLRCSKPISQILQCRALKHSALLIS